MLRIFFASTLLIGFSFPASANEDLFSIDASDKIVCSANPDVGIGIDPEFVGDQISRATSCFEASNIAENCAAGSSLDQLTAGYAISKCDSFTGKLSPNDASLKAQMQERCRNVCNPLKDGTICISIQSFCLLDVSKFLNSVNTFSY